MINKDHTCHDLKLEVELHTLAAEFKAFKDLLAERDRVYSERDHRYEDRFKGSDQAVKDALAAQKELTGTAFASSEKAIIKAEDAQKSYNERTNELRGALNDQNKTLLARTEAEARFTVMEQRMEEMKKDSIGVKDDIKQDISDLRQSRSENLGKIEAQTSTHNDNKWIIGLTVVVIFNVLGMVATLIYFLVGK